MGERYSGTPTTRWRPPGGLENGSSRWRANRFCRLETANRVPMAGVIRPGPGTHGFDQFGARDYEGSAVAHTVLLRAGTVCYRCAKARGEREMFGARKHRGSTLRMETDAPPQVLLCPACDSDEVRRSSIHSVAERVRAWRGKRPYLCLNCFHRFTRSSRLLLKRDVAPDAQTKC